MRVDRPYAAFMGVRMSADAMGAPLCTLVPSERIAGDPGLLHGGALAGLLEAAAGALVEAALDDAEVKVEPISITVDYVRPGTLAETHATAEMVRRGERIVHVDATAWQEDPERPIAMGRLVFSLRRDIG